LALPFASRLKFRNGCGPDGIPSKLNAFLPQRTPRIPAPPSAANAGRERIIAAKVLKAGIWRFIS
jgi:hypothetical protein